MRETLAAAEGSRALAVLCAKRFFSRQGISLQRRS